MSNASDTFDRPGIPTPPQPVGFALMQRVIAALVLLEATKKHSGYKLGYIWAIVEPCIVIIGFYAIFYFSLGRGNENLFGFLISGLGMLYIFFECKWRHNCLLPRRAEPARDHASSAD